MNEKQKLKGMTGFEEQETTGVSPWMLALVDELGRERKAPHWTYSFNDFSFEILEGTQSLWLVTRFPAGNKIAFRPAYCPDGELKIDEIQQTDAGIKVAVSSTVGDYHVQFELPRSDHAVLHYKTMIKPVAPLVIPFWPRDVIPLGKEDELTESEGIIHAQQAGPRSGLLFFSATKPTGGTVLYFQNLTSLNEYARQTETSLSDTVGGQWPELGFALPATTEKPLETDQEIVLSDAYILFSPEVPKDDLRMARQFLDFLAQIYLMLPRLETEYIHWPEVAERSLRDLTESGKCQSEVRGRRFLKAYVGDTDNPPESMVQMTVLLPLLEYAQWSGEEIPLTEELLAGLHRFYDDEAGVLGRWLVSEQNKLDGSEPQKKPESMDSWYLYHSLLNLSRLALHGHKMAKKLFLDSLEYAIKVAHKFEYHFPVFYDLYTLEIIKAETKEGQGGELDVAGLYAHVMLQAYELTQDELYLDEAKKAARTLKGYGFRMFYQANETLFGAGALLRLYKATGDEKYLDLSYLSLANVFNNMWLWECNYGYAEHYKTFFALFPLKEAPYTAVYEELEGFAAFHDYLGEYGRDIPEWANILLAEYIRNMLYRASFYYPPNLPKEVMSEKPKTGELDPKLWIPLEDIYDGWEQEGQVGQEVYGAGMPFAIVARHYMKISDEKFMIFVDYPILDFSSNVKGEALFHVLGDQRLSCRLRIMATGRAKLPTCVVITERGENQETLRGRNTPEGHIEYELFGDRTVIVRWEAKKRGSHVEKKSRNERKGKKK